MDFEETRLYYSHQQLHQQQQPQQQQQQHQNSGAVTAAVVTPNNNQNHNNNDEDDSQVPVEAVRRHFREFLRNYRLGGVSRYIYREKLIRMHRRLSQQNLLGDADNNDNNGINDTNQESRRTNNASSRCPRAAKIQVDMAHIGEYDPSLLGYIRDFPARTIPCIESAAVDALASVLYEIGGNNSSTSNAAEGEGIDPSSSQMDVDNFTNDQTTGMNNNNNNGNLMEVDKVDAMMILRGLQIQVLLWGSMKPTPLRSIKSEHMNRLLKCPGIVISTSIVRVRAVQLSVRCPKCQDTRTVTSTDGPFGSIRLPFKCSGSATNQQDCGAYPYITVPDESIFVDQQTLKLQESPERVPTGEMPRSVLLAVERSLVDLAPPGTRVSIMCIPTMFTFGGGGGAGNKMSTNISKAVYLRVVGMKKDNDAHGEAVTFTPVEEEAFCTLSKRHDVYDILYRSIAPDIQGSYTVDIKKALLCQLFSGSRKKLPDGVSLRGDINVLLLGDPSMAKSQFLKFVSKVAPVGIYTSGKGSSAAGLTASVVRDPKGEFYIEGGAMVLADGGIVCIDEFDKMRPNDRVAIHEAMEQQTISVAKAGITTVLNTRASVLAAANPVYGRYDDCKTASENIDLMTTILSRFDMIFLVRDIREEERDKLICQHVMGVHISNSRRQGGGYGGSEFLGHAPVRPSGTGTSSNSNDMDGLFLASSTAGASMHDGTDENTNDDSGVYSNSSPEAIAENVMKVAATGLGELDVASLKKYIQYCKAKCSPRLSDEAGDVLTSSYVKIRDDVRKQCLSATMVGGSHRNGNNRQHQSSSSQSHQPVIPITVRQLEALVRISESLAKLRIDPIVRAEDVTEALRLFKVSTMAASSVDQMNSTSGGPGLGLLSGVTNVEEMERTEAFLRSRLTVGNLLNRLKLIEEGASLGFNAMVVAKCLSVMAGRGDLLERNQGRLIKRIK